MIEFEHPVTCGLDRKWPRRWGYTAAKGLGFPQYSSQPIRSRLLAWQPTKMRALTSKITFDKNRCFPSEHMILLKCMIFECEENEVAIYINQSEASI